MIEKINNENLSKIKLELENLNEYQVELESEIEKTILIDNTIYKHDDLNNIKKGNNELIEQVRYILDTSINNE